MKTEKTRPGGLGKAIWLEKEWLDILWDEDFLTGVISSRYDNLQQQDAEKISQLWAATGTAASEVADLGYDPIEAVKALPRLLESLFGVHESNRDMCFCLDTKGRGLGQCRWCDARQALAAARGEKGEEANG